MMYKMIEINVFRNMDLFYQAMKRLWEKEWHQEDQEEPGEAWSMVTPVTDIMDKLTDPDITQSRQRWSRLLVTSTRWQVWGLVDAGQPRVRGDTRSQETASVCQDVFTADNNPAATMEVWGEFIMMILPGCQTSDSANRSKFHHLALLALHVVLVPSNSNCHHWPLLTLLVVLVSCSWFPF